MTLTAEHRTLLADAAVDELVAVEAGVVSITTRDQLPDELATWRRRPAITPGILFPSTGPDGTVAVQYRPDVPVVVPDEDRPRKYLFPTGSRPVVNTHPRMVPLLSTATTIVVVEGTKQYLAAVSAAPAEVLVVGVAGCDGWRSAGVPLPDWNVLPIPDADVVVAFDADVATNENVWSAGELLAEHLAVLGAARVRFLRAPAGAKAGLDDYLASVVPGRRTDALARLVERAGDLPKKPAKKRAPKSDDPAGRFFDTNGFRPVDAVAELRAERHHALGPDGSIWTYNANDGIYVDDPHALVAGTRDLLGNRYRGLHHRTVVELLGADLAQADRRLPDAPIGRLVPVRNGLLDVRTRHLHPHDPSHLAYARLAVDWDPDARCPNFDRWLVEQCGAQADDLLEAVGLLLAPWAAQRKVPFLIGPTRSGKGTFMRVIEALIPDAHRSAETLHAIATNRFAVAQLHGKILNSAGDLSDHHVEDLSLFKMLTGDDTVSAERKFRDAFTFRNTALFLFNANTPPTVSESSRAYLARVRPYLFPHSYEGAEDPAVEAALMAELPGVLVRLVDGVQRWLDRGGYAPVNPVVADLFGRQSDPVAMFVAQVLAPDADGFVSTSDLHDAYVAWTSANGRGTLGRNKLLARAENALGARERERSDGRGSRGWRGWRVLAEADWSDDDSTYALSAPSIAPVAATSVRQEPADETPGTAPDLPSSATSATSSPTSPHEAMHGEGEQVEVIPREGEVGRELAELADDSELPPDLDLLVLERAREFMQARGGTTLTRSDVNAAQAEVDHLLSIQRTHR